MEMEGELKEETVKREREEDGEKWRENVFNYSALPMFSIYGSFRGASRNYIYTVYIRIL